jgi:hypothetical protein
MVIISWNKVESFVAISYGKWTILLHYYYYIVYQRELLQAIEEEERELSLKYTFYYSLYSEKLPKSTFRSSGLSLDMV